MLQQTSSYLRGRLFCAAAIFVAILGSTAPSPLYPIFNAQLHLSHAAGTAVYAIYAIGTLFALFLTGRIGSRIRDLRRLIVPGLLITGLGALLFAVAGNLYVLLAGRFLNGFGTGMVTGMASVELYNLAPMPQKRFAGAIATLVFTGGAAGGPLISSAALSLNFYPVKTPFLLIFALSLICSAGLIAAEWPKTQVSAPEPRKAAPAQAANRQTKWSPYLLGCLAIGATWMLGSTLMAIGADLGLKVYHLPSAAMAGLIPALFQLFGGIGQATWSRVRAKRAITWGFAGMIVTQILLVQAMSGGSALVLGIFVASGFFYGAAFVGSLTSANAAAAPARRAALISDYYIVGYLANAIPALLMGALIDGIGLAPAFRLFSAVVIFVTAAGTIWALRLRG